VRFVSIPTSLPVGQGRIQPAARQASALYTWRGAVWLLLYLLFILAPILALLSGAHPPARDFWTEFSAAIGYSGLAMMGSAVRPYGALPIRQRAVGRRRHLLLSPPNLANSGWLGRGASGHPVCRPARTARVTQFHYSAVARPFRCAFDLFTNCARRNVALASEVKNQI